MEWRGLTRGFRTFPLRVGYRRAQLPFLFDGETPVERLAAAGIGLELFRYEDTVLGGLDLALERGDRRAGSLSEQFWRGTMTIRVSGF